MKASFFPIVCALALFSSLFAQQRKTSAIIAGCESKIDEKKWKDFRISFGISDLVADELYKSGNFKLIEEKGAIKEKLLSLRQKLWSGAYKDVTMAMDSLKNDSQVVVFSRLVYFGTPRSSVSMGPFGGSENAVVIKTEVVFVLPGGGRLTGKGEGLSTRMAMTTLFKFKDDGVFFEQTEIGQALQKAIVKATDDCIVQFNKRNQK